MISRSPEGDEKGDNPALREAIGLYRDLLAATSRQERPQDWATTQNNLGAALSRLGVRENSLERLQQAKDAIQSASTLYREAGLSQYEAYFEERLNALEPLIERLEKE